MPSLDMIYRFMATDAGAAAAFTGLSEKARVAATATGDLTAASLRAADAEKLAADAATRAADLRLQASQALAVAKDREVAGDTEGAAAAREAADALRLQATAARATSVELNANAVAAERQAAAIRTARDAQVTASSEGRLTSTTIHGLIGEATGLTGAMERIPAPVTVVAGALGKLGVGVVATGAAIAAFSLDAAAKYQSALTRLTTGAGESERGLAVVQKQLLADAGPLAESATSLAQAMYPIESAGFHAGAGVQVLTAAVQGAKADGADIGTVADAVTSALNAYGLKAGQAKGVTNEFVKAVSLGKVPMQDLAESIGTAVPEAAALKVPLDQVLAGITTMTMQGTNASKAATSLRFAMASLANPTGVATAQLKLLGLSSASLGDVITQHGLVAGFEALERSVGEKFPRGSHQYLAALANVVGGTRGLQAVLELTGRHMDEFSTSADKIGRSLDKSGANVDGWGKYTKTFAYNLDSAKDALDALAVELGEKLLPDATKALHWLATDGVADLQELGLWFEKNGATIGDFGADVILTFRALIVATTSWAQQTVDLADDAFGWVPGLGGKLASARKAVDLFETTSYTSLTSLANGVRTAGNDLASNYAAGIAAKSNAVTGAVSRQGAAIQEQYTANIGKGESSGAAAAQAYATGIDDKKPQAQQAATNLAKEAAIAMRNGQAVARTAGQSVGAAMSEGLLAGLGSRRGAIAAEAGNLSKEAAIAMKDAAQVNSPSKLTIPIGSALGEGLEVGMHSRMAAVSAQAKQMVSVAVEASKQVAAALAKAVAPDVTKSQSASTLAGILGTSSTSAVAAQQAADLAAQKLAYLQQSDGLTAAQDRYNRALADYQAFENKLSGISSGHRSAEDRAELASLNASKEAAQKNLSAIRDASTKSIDAAKQAAEQTAQAATKATTAAATAAKNLLSNLTSSASSMLSTIKDFQSTVSQGLTGDDSLSTLWSGLSGTDSDGNALTPTVAGLQSSLNSTLATAQTFATQLKQIAAEGGSQSFITQILGMGPTEGSQVASQLLAGGQSVIKGMSQTLDQINALTTVQSQQLSQTFYGQGAKALQSYILGLEAKFPALRKALAPLASELSTVFGQPAPSLSVSSKNAAPTKADYQREWEKAEKRAGDLLKEVRDSHEESLKEVHDVATHLKNLVDRVNAHGGVNHQDLVAIGSDIAGLGSDIALSTQRNSRKNPRKK